MLRSDFSRLKVWLRSSRLPLLALRDGTASSRAEQIRALNSIESRFDRVLAKEMSPPIDWQQIRLELGLNPPETHPWYPVGDTIVDDFRRLGYSEERVARARRLWHDFLLVESGRLSATQAVEGWCAGLEYLLCRLYFISETRQCTIAERYYVSASTVSMRYRTLVETLGIVVFDHPARKRLSLLRALAVEAGPLSEREFRSRLLAGELSNGEIKGV